MKGLLLNDLYTVRSYGRTLGLYFAVFGGISVITGNPSYAFTLAVVLVMTITLSCFTYDEFYHWERYAAAAPVSRRQIVAARYLLLLLLAAAGSILSLACIAVASLLSPQVDLPEAVVSLFAAVTVDTTLFSLSIPFLYKFGSQKGRGVMMFLFGLVFVLAVSLSYWKKFFPALPQGIPLAILTAGGLILCVALFLGSFFVSVAVYSKKELR